MATAAAMHPLDSLRALRADQVILVMLCALLGVGLVAVASASVAYANAQTGDTLFLVRRYVLHLALAALLAGVVYRVPVDFWHRSGWLWLLVGFVMLALVLIPGVGREVNGSRRWLALGPLTVQCSEFVKWFLILYMAGYLVRRKDELRSSWSGFIKPMAVLFMVTLLLLLEPDFGAAVVTSATAMGLLFIGGVRLGQFLLVMLGAVAALGLLMISAPYRMQRLTSFADPWADQFNSGYQLTQSLIAFGRGEWFGVGLGNSVQKLFYLPEAHTDFVFAIWAEEQGLVGAVLVVLLYAGLVAAVLTIASAASRAGKPFHAFVASGVALLLSCQVFINIGVATGMLPTKGLTLPFMSYGGSSLLVCLALLATVLRIARECREVSDGR
ncbi:MAG TPA: putative lipid II flippase FtsW [Spongiibacteraceae bacterium]|nr:putative lipid II flippase FtsW [Spongiibacteraceae bacterium]